MVAMENSGFEQWRQRERERERQRLTETMFVCQSDVREKLRAFSVSEKFMRLR